MDNHTILLFIIMTVLAPVSLSAQEYRKFIEQGDEYYSQFDNQGALRAYEQAYQLAPDEFEVLTKLIRVYNDVGEDLDSKESQAYFEKAVQYAEVLLAKFPEKPDTYYWLSVGYGNLALFKGGKEKVKLSRQIEANARKAIELDPNYADAYVVLGVYYKEVANLNVLLKAFAKAFLGGLPKGTNEDAVQALQKAIDLKTSFLIYTHCQLAETYKEMKNKTKALEQYQIALDLPIADHADADWKGIAEKQIKQLSKK